MVPPRAKIGGVDHPASPLARDQFPILERWLPLNHAGVSPMSQAVFDAMRAHGQDSLANGSATIEDRFDYLDGIRARAARFMGAQPSEVAFVKNTTEGLSFVAEGFPWQAGDKVVVPDCEFPSNMLPWLALRNRGVQVVMLEAEDDESLPLERFEEVLKRGRVRMVATSWVQWGRGWRVDLEALSRLCHDYGALLCADIIQGLGCIPLDLHASGVDFAVSGAQKWLLGPEGIGLLYVSEQQIGLLRPMEAGWNAMAKRGGLGVSWNPSAKQFEGGIPNVAGTIGLGAALNLLVRAGVGTIWSHIDGLNARMVAGLQRMGADVQVFDAEHRSGMVSFELPGRWAGDVEDALKDEGVLVVNRAGRIRASPHAYMHDGDVDRFLEVLARV
jgi:selenocysteine lyase/cysteine desulfurase